MGNGWSPAAPGAATELALGLEAVSMIVTHIFQGELPAPNSWRERASQKYFPRAPKIACGSSRRTGTRLYRDPYCNGI